MSIFNRIAGTEEPKIPVWPVMMEITRLMDAEITFADLVQIYGLSQAEQLEIGEYLTAIQALVTGEVTERMRIGMGQAFAMRDGRVAIDAVLRYALLRIEQGTMTLEVFREKLGLSND